MAWSVLPVRVLYNSTLKRDIPSFSGLSTLFLVGVVRSRPLSPLPVLYLLVF